jgi:hypothetical protein
MATAKIKKKDCKGATCGLSPYAQELASHILSNLSKRAKGSGVGSSSLTKDEVSLLKANQEFLSNATPAQITKRATDRGTSELLSQGIDISGIELAAVTDAVWGLLDKATKKHMRSKGSLAAGSYLNPRTGGHGNANEARAKLLLGRFIAQNGRDAYTGEPIGLTSCDLEHIEPFSVYGKAAERLDNMVFTSSSVNQRKAELTFSEFYKTRVDPIAEASSSDPEYWNKLASDSATKREAKNAVDDLLKAKPYDSWTDKDVANLGAKYYYTGRALGHNLAYTKTRPEGRGKSGQNFSLAIGVPMAKAFAKAYGGGVGPKDQSRIDALENARVRLVESANAESAVTKGNIGSKSGPTLDLFKKLQLELSI